MCQIFQFFGSAEDLISLAGSVLLGAKSFAAPVRFTIVIPTIYRLSSSRSKAGLKTREHRNGGIALSPSKKS
jgi:hypothetical protein